MKKMEKDYNALKMEYDSLKTRHDALLQEKAKNYSEMVCMKEKLKLTLTQTQMEVQMDQMEMEQNKQDLNKKRILESQLDDHNLEAGYRVPTPYSKEVDKTSMVKPRSLICGKDGNEESNYTQATHYLTSKLVSKANDSARSLILSLNTCNSHTPELPTHNSETVVRRVLPSSTREAMDYAVKVEPHDMINEDTGNSFTEAEEEEDIPWWDW